MVLILPSSLVNTRLSLPPTEVIGTSAGTAEAFEILPNAVKLLISSMSAKSTKLLPIFSSEAVSYTHLTLPTTPYV